MTGATHRDPPGEAVVVTGAATGTGEAIVRASAGLRDASGPVSVPVRNAARDDRHRARKATPEHRDERAATDLRRHPLAAQAPLDGLRAAGGGWAVVGAGSVS